MKLEPAFVLIVNNIMYTYLLLSTLPSPSSHIGAFTVLMSSSGFVCSIYTLNEVADLKQAHLKSFKTYYHFVTISLIAMTCSEARLYP